MRKIGNPLQLSDLLLDVLLALFERPLASGELASALGELREREVALATFYRQLQRAVDQGWVEMTEATTRSGPGRPQRLYRITDAGAQVLQSGIAQQARRVSIAEALGLRRTEQAH